MSFLCDKCKKEYKNKGSLSNHLKSCSIIYLCQYCNKSFSFKKNLQYHTDEKVCPEYTKYIENKLKECQEKILSLENKDIKIQELYLELKLTQDNFDKKIQYKDTLISNKDDKIRDLTSQLKMKQEEYKTTLDINLNLSSKVGNTNNIQQINNINNNINLPALTDDTIGEKIDNIKVDHKLNSIKAYCKNLSLDSYAYLSDVSRKILVFNNGSKDIKDKEGDILSNRIALHPFTKKKKEEIETFINEQKKIAKYEDKYFNDNLFKIEEMNKNIDNPSLLKEEFPYILKHKNYMIENKDKINNITNFQQNLLTLIYKYPKDFLFGSIAEFISSNKYFKDSFRLIILDDNDNEHILIEENLLSVLINAYENIITIKKPLSETEIKAFISIFKITDTYKEHNFEVLNNKIKWLSELKENDKVSINKMKELLEDISNL